MKKTLLGIILLAGVVALPPNALAGDRYFCSETTGDWDDGSGGLNWDSNAACDNGDTGVPTAADQAIIQSGKTCNVNVTTAVADHILVESTATLNIQSGQKLELRGLVSSTSTITGTLNITASGEDIGELAIVDNNQTIDGGGKIVGQDNAAKITIAADKTVTSQVVIEGRLQIVPVTGGTTTTFRNENMVHANAFGTLLVNTKFVQDTAGDRWKVSTLNASILQFDPTDSTRPDLAGDFTVVQGKLDIDGVGFGTTGKLTMTGGMIVFDVEGSPEPVRFSDS